MITPFGLFLLLGFVAAWFIFRLEYRRKEAEGIIKPFAAPAGIVHPVLWGLFGFVGGAKLVYWWLHRNRFIGTPQDFIFSLRGNLIAGIVCALAAWWIAKRLSSPKAVTEVIHPYQLMDRLLLYCGLFGFAG